MAEQIKSLKDYKLTTGATVDFHTRANILIDAATPVALHIEDLAATYTTQIGTLDTVVNRSTVQTERTQIPNS